MAEHNIEKNMEEMTGAKTQLCLFPLGTENASEYLLPEMKVSQEDQLLTNFPENLAVDQGFW